MKVLIIIASLLMTLPAINFAQCDGGDNTTQPSIMVVPVILGDQDILAVIESNQNYRSVIIAIDDHFKSRGFNTKNFVQNLRNIRREEGINNYTDSQSELDAVIARAGPDIWINTEIMISEEAGNTRSKSLTITIQAIHRISSENMASKVFDGRYSYVTDFGQRARKLLEKDLQFESFLEDINESFGGIRESGISFALSIVCYRDAEVRLNVEIGDDFEELSDFISEYVIKQSYKSSPQANTRTSTKLAWENLKVPLKIPEDGDCINYNIKKHFLNPLRKKIRSDWAPLTELGSIYPQVINDGVGKWTIILCDSKDDCPSE
ncbi:MAG: hypothetical protein ACI8VT_004486 [Saprospiraceae bacterium]|jgi:hypothetical protein